MSYFSIRVAPVQNGTAENLQLCSMRDLIFTPPTNTCSPQRRNQQVKNFQLVEESLRINNTTFCLVSTVLKVGLSSSPVTYVTYTQFIVTQSGLIFKQGTVVIGAIKRILLSLLWKIFLKDSTVFLSYLCIHLPSSRRDSQQCAKKTICMCEVNAF